MGPSPVERNCMGTPAKIGNRNTRAGAVRGITAEKPEGWSPPEAAERLASYAKSMGWSVESGWGCTPEGLTFLIVHLGRMLKPGENSSAKGDRWLYKLVWEEIPEADRPNLHHSRMKLAVNRALTPNHNTWRDGPSLKMISDMIGRNPKPGRYETAVKAIKTTARSVDL